MISTQPGSTPEASFKIVSLEAIDPCVSYNAGNDFGNVYMIHNSMYQHRAISQNSRLHSFSFSLFFFLFLTLNILLEYEIEYFIYLIIELFIQVPSANRMMNKYLCKKLFRRLINYSYDWRRTEKESV